MQMFRAEHLHRQGRNAEGVRAAICESTLAPAFGVAD
jgi:hypothetical protein